MEGTGFIQSGLEWTLTRDKRTLTPRTFIIAGSGSTYHTSICRKAKSQTTVFEFYKAQTIFANSILDKTITNCHDKVIYLTMKITASILHSTFTSMF